MSVVGAKRTFWNVGCLVAIGGKADISQRLEQSRSSAAHNERLRAGLGQRTCAIDCTDFMSMS